MMLRDALLRGRRRPRSFGSGSPTTYRGDGYEFIELRAYVPGDDVRRIDWAATARSGDLQTRVVLEDVALTLGAIVDDSPSMRVGRRRPLLEAAHEALRGWFGSVESDDRALRVSSDYVAPSRSERGVRGVRTALADPGVAFVLQRALETARAALPRGTALLVISDWYDLDESFTPLLAKLAARCDCTALIARDPWYDGLPLRGLVRLRGAEGGALRTYIGKRERDAFAKAVRTREADLINRFQEARWRVGVLREDDGAASLAEAFGIAPHEVRA